MRTDKDCFRHEEIEVGLEVQAPFKRGRKRKYEKAVVVWASDDGFVVEARTVPKKRGRGQQISASFACAALRRPDADTSWFNGAM